MFWSIVSLNNFDKIWIDANIFKLNLNNFDKIWIDANIFKLNFIFLHNIAEFYLSNKSLSFYLSQKVFLSLICYVMTIQQRDF